MVRLCKRSYKVEVVIQQCNKHVEKLSAFVLFVRFFVFCKVINFIGGRRHDRIYGLLLEKGLYNLS